MLLCKKIRLEVSEKDAAALEFMQGKCRGLYNWLLMRLRNGERWRLAKEKARLVECRAYDPELNDVYGKLLAEVYFRLDNAMKAFFRRVANGEVPGFPRVRPRHAFFTLSYPAMYVKVEGNVVLLPTGGLSEKTKRFSTIRAGLTESAPPGYEEVAISRDARGHYYASMPLYKRRYRCGNCGLIMDRDENSAINILGRFLARLGPHVADATRCADVFTATTTFNRVEDSRKRNPQ